MVSKNRSLLLAEVLANPNPKLFTMQDGRPISFHLKAADDERCLVAAVRKSIKTNGGRYIRYFQDMDRQTVLLVTDKGFEAPDSTRPSFCVTLIGDCILANHLKNLDTYIYPRDEVKRWKNKDLHDMYCGKGNFFKKTCRRRLPFATVKESSLNEQITDSRTDDRVMEVDEDEESCESYEKSIKEESESDLQMNETEDVKPKIEYPPKRGRGNQDRYRSREKVAILRYLVENKKFSNLRGDLVWREMACQNICPNRPWQSLKNHFLKYLLPNLDLYVFLTEEQKRKFICPTSPDKSDDDDNSSFFYFTAVKRRFKNVKN